LERKLTAILCADVYGYSRLMGEDEEATLRTLSSHRRLVDSLIEQHRGRFVNSAGDSVLAEFSSIVNAVQCAVEIQNTLKAENLNLAPARRMEFRMGVNSGDVMVEGEQIYGDGVNVAARLESLADPGGICVSGVVHDQVRGKLGLNYQDLGAQQVKNIAEPVRVWRVLLDGVIPSRGILPMRPRYWRRGVLSLTGFAIIAATIFLVQHLSLKPPRTHASIPSQEKPALALPTIPSIAVLPFINLSGDPQQEYFSDGISIQLIEDLSRLPGLLVTAHNFSFSYKGKTLKEQELGRELGVKYLLEGNVQKSPERVRIGVELVDAGSGAEMWTQRFDRPLTDIFAVQDEIVEKVVTTLRLLLKSEETKVPWRSLPTTSNLQAFDDLLRATEYASQFTKDGNLKQRHWLERAEALDPHYADAYAWLGGTYTQNVLFGWSENPQADLNHASALAQKALEFDDSNVGAFETLCAADWLQRRFDEAVEECNRAVGVAPNNASAYVELSDALLVSNRPEEAARAAERAMRLDPGRRDFYAYFIAAPYVQMARYQDAIPLLRRYLAVYPNMPWAHAMLIMAYTELGREQEAQAEATELKRVSPHFLVHAHAAVSKNPVGNKRLEDDLRKAGMN
jgi:adenylate cyclase